jgi:hypothetical protein
LNRLYYCDHHAIPLPDGHKFPMRKYAMVRGLLSADGVFRFEPAARVNDFETAGIRN